MKTTYFIFGVLVIIVIIVAFNWNKVKAWIAGPPAQPLISDYDKCIASNKVKTDGESCSNCIPEGSGNPIFNGVIVNGECNHVQKQTPSKYIVSNPSGATIYEIKAGTFVVTGYQKPPYGTQIQIQSIDPSKQYVSTNYGWISTKDIAIN